MRERIYPSTQGLRIQTGSKHIEVIEEPLDATSFSIQAHLGSDVKTEGRHIKHCSNEQKPFVNMLVKNAGNIDTHGRDAVPSSAPVAPDSNLPLLLKPDAELTISFDLSLQPWKRLGSLFATSTRRFPCLKERITTNAFSMQNFEPSRLNLYPSESR